MYDYGIRLDFCFDRLDAMGASRAESNAVYQRFRKIRELSDFTCKLRHSRIYRAKPEVGSFESFERLIRLIHEHDSDLFRHLGSLRLVGIDQEGREHPLVDYMKCVSGDEQHQLRFKANKQLSEEILRQKNSAAIPQKMAPRVHARYARRYLADRERSKPINELQRVIGRVG